MKKYIFIIIALLSLNSFAQTTPPTGLVPFLKSIFYHDPVSNIDWVYRGSTYGWAKVGSPTLYTTTGTNTDGAMTQQATTTALGTKLNSSRVTATSGFLPYLDTSGNIANSNIRQDLTTGYLAVNFPSAVPPQHQLVINSTTENPLINGISIYNNFQSATPNIYEKFNIGRWAGNEVFLETESNGGVVRPINLKSGSSIFKVSSGQNDVGSTRAVANVTQDKAGQFVVSGNQSGTTQTFGMWYRGTVNKSGAGIFNGGGVSIYLQNYVPGNANRLWTLGTNAAPAGDVAAAHTGYYDFYMDKFVSVNPIFAPAATVAGQVVNLGQLNGALVNKPVRMLTGNTTITTSDYYVALTSGDGTFTLPAGLTTNMEFVVKNKGTGVLTIGGTVDGIVNPQFNTQGSGLRVQWNGTSFDKTGSF